ncbi:MAG: type II toxin-antitoxin system HicB family antitoxin [Leptolyngbyaceae bacterium]|nr:type II toxin-antitoxin system HicB family antitoxin [Leptolyngbyaceae bacterium]
MRLPVVIHKDIDSDYGVTVPDLPGCFSAGTTIDEALLEVIEAIECHVEGLLMDDDLIPEPLPIEIHQQNPDFANGIWAFVDVDLAKLSGKKQQVNIAISERILTRIDNLAQQSGTTRSNLMTTAALEYIAKQAEMSKQTSDFTIKAQ